jgi:2-aminobenzoate-CoA ligase
VSSSHDRRTRDSYCDDRLPPVDQWPTILPLPTVDTNVDVLNCGEWLLGEWITDSYGHRTCLLTDQETWSYREVADRSNQIAQVLVEDLGVRPGNRVLLHGFNNPWTVASWLAIQKAGAVAVTSVPLLRAGELRTIGEIAQPTVALCDIRLCAELEAAQIAGLTVVAFGGADPDDLTARSAAKPVAFTAVPTAPTDVALLAFTSGTTGRPKATMHSHRDILAIVDTFSRTVLRPQGSDIFAGSPPIGFTFGLGGLVVFPLSVGASVVLIERGSPELLLDAVTRHKVSVLFTAPTAYRAMIDLLPGRDTSSLRRCVSAGEPLPANTWHAFREATGVRLIDGIGSTEMLHIFISAADDDIRPGATGRPVAGYEARVVDAHGNPLPDGTIGRLAVRGPTGCRYLDDERQHDYVRDGWNFTGDNYIRDEDGYFWFQSRSDDMIISGGYNIAPPEVEHALMLHPQVAEAAVVGKPDTTRGQIVTAYVVLKAAGPGEGIVRELQDFVKGQIAPFKYPRVIHLVDSLPKTSTGKLTRFRLRHQVTRSTDADVDRAGSPLTT